jgi:hypothetical protein
MKLIDMASDTARPDDDRVVLYEANNKIIRLEGEAKVLRILLGKCVDVIDTIPGESDDECRRLLRLKDSCIEAMKVVL